jgi:hypothetical protein
VRLAGWMTLFGATVLMVVSLIEITFYIAALFPDPAVTPFICLRVISAVQHLYFIVATPALFLPLGIVLVGSPVFSVCSAISRCYWQQFSHSWESLFCSHLCCPRESQRSMESRRSGGWLQPSRLSSRPESDVTMNLSIVEWEWSNRFRARSALQFCPVN